MAEVFATSDELAPARSTRRELGRGSGFLLVALLVVIWEAVARLGIVTSTDWPPFSEVAQRLVVGLLSGELLSVIAPTLRVTFEGFALGCLFAIPTGLLIAVSSWCRRLVQPTVDLLRPIPIPAILPPLIFLLGLGDAKSRVGITSAARSYHPSLARRAKWGLRGIAPAPLRTRSRTENGADRDFLALRRRIHGQDCLSGAESGR